MALAWRYVDDEWAHALMEVLNTPNMLDTMLDDAITRGLQQGLQQGQVEGKREALRTIIRTRFGIISKALDQRINAADADTLETLIAGAAVAKDIKEL